MRDPHVSVVYVYDGPKGTLSGVERTVNVVPGMRYLDLEHEVGHVHQLTDPTRFPDGPPAFKHVHYDPSGRMHTINDLPRLTKPQNVIAEYHVRVEEYLRLRERGVPEDVLSRHREGVLEYRREYQDVVRHKHRDQRWRDEHFSDIPLLDAKFRALGDG